MPPPPSVPGSFAEILELIWWRLDCALDEEMIRASARLGALEALQRGCTAIIDHHESPNSIEGSLSVIADACTEVGVRVSCAYGVTDRHGPQGAKLGLEENERFLAECAAGRAADAAASDKEEPERGSGDATTGITAAGASAEIASAETASMMTRGMVGVHASFTCEPETLEAAADLAKRHGVGVHIHVGEGEPDKDATQVLKPISDSNWLLVHGVLLPDEHGLSGTVVHNPRSNMNNSVGYARPARFANPVALGTDGIGADMLEEFRLAYVCLRAEDATASPETPWAWLKQGEELFPEVREDSVVWSYDNIDPWHLAFTTGVSPLEVKVAGETVFADGAPTRVDAQEVKAHAREQAQRLFQKLA